MRKIAKTNLLFPAVIVMLGLNTTGLMARTIVKSDADKATVTSAEGGSNSTACGCKTATNRTHKSSSYAQRFIPYTPPADVDITDECLDFMHCTGSYDCLIKSLRCAGSDMPFFLDLVMY